MIEIRRETCQLKISLQDVKPSIWRRFLVSSTMPLSKLNEVIQQVMGWANCHLHDFDVDGKRYGVPDPEFGIDDDLLDETGFLTYDLLKQEGDSLLYSYDYGDGWQHNLQLEKVLPYDPDQQLPYCTAGSRGCPPEDVGGVWGYETFLEAYKDKKHPRHEEMTEWAGDYFHPESFDPDEVNEILHS